MEFFERHQGGEKAILVHLDLKQQSASLDEDLSEFVLLAKSAGADILATVTGSRQKPDARLYAGSGKVAELAALVHEKDADLVMTAPAQPSSSLLKMPSPSAAQTAPANCPTPPTTTTMKESTM